MERIRVAHGVVTALALLALAVPGLSAQTTFGLRGGVTVSSVELDLGETFDDSNRTGFTGGVFVDFAGSGLLGLQLGAQYTQKGAELEIDDVVDDLTLNYLEIPAVLKLGIPLGGLKPSLLGGVALGFQASCDAAEAWEADCEEDVKSVEWSGVLGADVVLHLGGPSLWVDGRYHFGLNDLSDAVEIDELKTRAWMLQAGLGFPLGG